MGISFKIGRVFGGGKFMKPVAIALLGMAVSGLSTSCIAGKPTIKGSGVAKTESREVEQFDRVAVGGAFDVVVKIGEPQSVVISADDNLLEHIDTEVKNGQLRIDSDESLQSKQDIKVEITVKSLKAAALAGSGDMKIDGVKEPELKLAIAGSGDVKATGAVEDLETSVAGSGSFKLEDLDAKTAKVEIAGSGDAALRVSTQLKVSIAGSGDVTYIGSPDIKKSIAGSGNVRQKQMQ